MVTLTPRVPLLRDTARSLPAAALVAAAPLERQQQQQQQPRGTCRVWSTSSRSRRHCHGKILNVRSTAGPTGSRHRRKVSVRATEASPGDLLTEAISAEEDGETCEIVQGSYVLLGEGPDATQAYLIQAIKNNNGVAVLCLTDDYGFEDEENRGFAYRLACFGYNVLLPDLFQGAPWSKESPKSEYKDWQELHSSDTVTRSINVATKYLFEEIDSAGKLAVIGFGFGGGRLIEMLARDTDQLYGTGAFVCGTGFEPSLAKKVQVPLLLIAGDKDSLCPQTIIHQIVDVVKDSKAKVYPGFGHAFVHRPLNAEEDEVSEDAFTEIRHWLHEHLLSDLPV